MNLGTGNRRQTMLAAVLGVLAVAAVIYIYVEVFSTPTTVVSTPQAVVPVAPVVTQTAARPAGKKAKTVGITSAALDPTLHMEAMLVSEGLQYSGSGRNIFSASSAPPVIIPTAMANARPTPPPPVIPCPPNCPPPPPPPPIELKFFGTAAGSNGVRQAILLHDDNVILASAGDIVVRRYRIISVDAHSLQVQDMQNNNTQTLPLLAN